MNQDQQKQGSDWQSRIVIVDDHPIVREGLARILNRDPSFEVCGSVGTSAEAMSVLKAETPDLVLVDVSLGGESGLQLVEEIRSKHSKMGILVVSMHAEEVTAERSFQAGANGYVMKENANDVVVVAIRTVLSGGTYLSDKMTDKIREEAVDLSVVDSFLSLNNLTDRELELFNLVGRGLTPTQIGKKLFISTKTVESHRENIKCKLKLTTSNELLQYAIKFRMVQ